MLLDFLFSRSSKKLNHLVYILYKSFQLQKQDWSLISKSSLKKQHECYKQEDRQAK